MYKERNSDRLKVENMEIDQVRSFSYLATIVNGNNKLEEEIRERIAKGNKAFTQIKMKIQRDHQG